MQVIFTAYESNFSFNQYQCGLSDLIIFDWVLPTDESIESSHHQYVPYIKKVFFLFLNIFYNIVIIKNE